MVKGERYLIRLLSTTRRSIHARQFYKMSRRAKSFKIHLTEMPVYRGKVLAVERAVLTLAIISYRVECSGSC